MQHNNSTFISTLSGFVLTVAMIPTHEMITAVVLGAIGSISGFFVSLLLRWIRRRFFRKTDLKDY